MFDLEYAERLVQYYGGDLGIAWEECTRAEKKWRPDRGAAFKTFWTTYYKNRIRANKRFQYAPIHANIPAPEPQEPWEWTGQYSDIINLWASGWSEAKIQKELKLPKARYEIYRQDARTHYLEKRVAEV